MKLNPEEWFKRMHDAAEHPEKAGELAHPPRERGVKPKQSAPLSGSRQKHPNWFAEWEEKQEERGEKRRRRNN